MGFRRFSFDVRNRLLKNADFIRIPGAAFIGNDGFGIGSVNFSRGGAPLGVDSDFDLVADSVLTPAGGLTDNDFSNVAAKIELDWRPNDDWLYFLPVSRGVVCQEPGRRAAQHTRVPVGGELRYR